jgi:hypothetical protein
VPEGKLVLRNTSGPGVLELDAQLAPDDLSVIVFDRTPPHLIIWEAHAQHVMKK